MKLAEKHEYPSHPSVAPSDQTSWLNPSNTQQPNPLSLNYINVRVPLSYCCYSNTQTIRLWLNKCTEIRFSLFTISGQNIYNI